MKKLTALALATTYVASSLTIANSVDLAPSGVSTEQYVLKYNQDLTSKYFEVIDEYFVQLLVQRRYITAQRIVWVYGCADKT